MWKENNKYNPKFYPAFKRRLGLLFSIWCSENNCKPTDLRKYGINLSYKMDGMDGIHPDTFLRIAAHFGKDGKQMWVNVWNGEGEYSEQELRKHADELKQKPKKLVIKKNTKRRAGNP